MTIIEMASYINGDLYTRECVPPVRCTPEMFAKVVKAAAASDTYERTIELVESYKNFLELQPDIANEFPVSEREEMFYCLKNGGYSPDVPAKCIYVLKHLYAKYGSVSLALKALSNGMFTVFFQKNYLHECTMRDVIKTFIDADYEPFTSARLRVEHETYDEVLITEKDMVALLPKDISAKLTDRDLLDIKVEKNGLSVNGLLIRFMCGHYGAVNSLYDLRRLV